MDVQSAECVVLRQQDFKEKDLLVTFLTRDRGRMKGIAKGVKQFTGRGVGRYEPLTHGTIFYVEKNRSDLVSIRKCDTLPPHFALQADYEQYLYGAYFTELLDRCPIAAHEAPAYFDLLLQGLTAVYSESSPAALFALRLRFEWRLLSLLGLQPEISVCLRCGARLFAPRSPAAAETADEPARPPLPAATGQHGFDPESGGVRCPDCQALGRGRGGLAASSLAYLAHLSAQPGRAQGPRPTRDNLMEVADAITPFLVKQFSSPPKSLGLLPQP